MCAPPDPGAIFGASIGGLCLFISYTTPVIADLDCQSFVKHTKKFFGLPFTF